MMLAGVPSALAGEALYDVYGRMDMALVLEKDMSYWEKRKIAKQKAAKIEAAEGART
jgi:hypothetical protein